MDLDLSTRASQSLLDSANEGMETPISASSSTQLFIDGIHIYGSRLFGLPPTEPTYLCNWDINVGAITGERTVDFLTALKTGGSAFGFTFDDDENALVTFSSVIFYDVTFLRAFVESVCRLAARSTMLLSVINRTYRDRSTTDWARSHYY